MFKTNKNFETKQKIIQSANCGIRKCINENRIRYDREQCERLKLNCVKTIVCL